MFSKETLIPILAVVIACELVATGVKTVAKKLGKRKPKTKKKA